MPIIYSIVIVFVFVLQFAFNGTNEYFTKYFIGFIGFGILGLQLGFLRPETKKVITLVALIGVLLCPLVLTMDMGKTITGGDDYGHWMGVSYGILRFICAILLLLFYYNIKGIKRLLLYASLLCYSIFYILFASRGSILALIVLILLIWIIKYSDNITKKNIIIWSVFSICVIVSLFFKEFLHLVISIADYFGIDTFAFVKMVAMINSGDLSNGRDELYGNALEGIVDSNFLGNGIGSFENKYQIYTHNLFLQSFYELGVFPFLLLIVFTFFTLKIILGNSYMKETKIFISFVFCAGIIELFFSSTLWISHIFWIWIGYVSAIISRKITIRTKKMANTRQKQIYTIYQNGK